MVELGKKERVELIRKLERERDGSRVIVYITGDRMNLGTKIAMDAFPFFIQHLSKMGMQEKIDLYLYSTGGITIAGYALVNTIREFCDQFRVIIPFKALSCATLIALGADEIIMTRMGNLSPIDPSVQHPLGPQAPVPGPVSGSQIVQVNVEDVVSYLEMAKTQLKLCDEESLVRVFERLAQSVHPLALGSVNRIREQIDFLARKLLSYHMKDERQIDDIVKAVIQGRYSHDYLIGRREAKEVLRLPIKDTSNDVEKTVLALYKEYDELLELSKPYHPESLLDGKESGKGTFTRAVIESADMTHLFKTTKEVRKVQLLPPAVPTPTDVYMERIESESWVEDK